MKKKYIKWFVFLTLVFIGSAVYFYNTERNRFAASTSYCLNTVIEQKWYGKNAENTIKKINSSLIDFENLLSAYIDTSEISVINSMAGESPVEITDETYDILCRAKELSLNSDRGFDITVLPLVKLWGVLGENPKVPEQSEIEEKLKLVNAENLILKEENGRKTAFLKEKGMGIDLGGIAKGAAADIVYRIACENKVTGYASLGGNITAVGKKPNGSNFNMGIRNPRGTASEYIGIVSLENETMATTGDYERYFIQDGVRYHHVLDIETGYPTDRGLISLTVISEDGMLVDAMSTEIFNKGLDGLGKYLKAEEYSVVAVDENLNVYVSDNLKEEFIFKDKSGKFSLKEYDFN